MPISPSSLAAAPSEQEAAAPAAKSRTPGPEDLLSKLSVGDGCSSSLDGSSSTAPCSGSSTVASAEYCLAADKMGPDDVGGAVARGNGDSGRFKTIEIGGTQLHVPVAGAAPSFGGGSPPSTPKRARKVVASADGEPAPVTPIGRRGGGAGATGGEGGGGGGGDYGPPSSSRRRPGPSPYSSSRSRSGEGIDDSFTLTPVRRMDAHSASVPGPAPSTPPPNYSSSAVVTDLALFRSSEDTVSGSVAVDALAGRSAGLDGRKFLGSGTRKAPGEYGPRDRSASVRNPSAAPPTGEGETALVLSSPGRSGRKKSAWSGGVDVSTSLTPVKPLYPPQSSAQSAASSGGGVGAGALVPARDNSSIVPAGSSSACPVAQDSAGVYMSMAEDRGDAGLLTESDLRRGGGGSRARTGPSARCPRRPVDRSNSGSLTLTPSRPGGTTSAVASSAADGVDRGRENVFLSLRNGGIGDGDDNKEDDPQRTPGSVRSALSSRSAMSGRSAGTGSASARYRRSDPVETPAAAALSTLSRRSERRMVPFGGGKGDGAAYGDNKVHRQGEEKAPHPRSRAASSPRLKPSPKSSGRKSASQLQHKGQRVSESLAPPPLYDAESGDMDSNEGEGNGEKRSASSKRGGQRRKSSGKQKRGSKSPFPSRMLKKAMSAPRKFGEKVSGRRSSSSSSPVPAAGEGGALELSSPPPPPAIKPQKSWSPRHKPPSSSTPTSPSRKTPHEVAEAIAQELREQEEGKGGSTPTRLTPHPNVMSEGEGPGGGRGGGVDGSGGSAPLDQSPREAKSDSRCRSSFEASEHDDGGRRGGARASSLKVDIGLSDPDRDDDCADEPPRSPGPRTPGTGRSSKMSPIKLNIDDEGAVEAELEEESSLTDLQQPDLQQLDLQQPDLQRVDTDDLETESEEEVEEEEAVKRSLGRDGGMMGIAQPTYKTEEEEEEEVTAEKDGPGRGRGGGMVGISRPSYKSVFDADPEKEVLALEDGSGGRKGRRRRGGRGKDVADSTGNQLALVLHDENERALAVIPSSDTNDSDDDSSSTESIGSAESERIGISRPSYTPDFEGEDEDEDEERPSSSSRALVVHNSRALSTPTKTRRNGSPDNEALADILASPLHGYMMGLSPETLQDRQLSAVKRTVHRHTSEGRYDARDALTPSQGGRHKGRNWTGPSGTDRNLASRGYSVDSLARKGDTVREWGGVRVYSLGEEQGGGGERTSLPLSGGMGGLGASGTSMDLLSSSASPYASALSGRSDRALTMGDIGGSYLAPAAAMSGRKLAGDSQSALALTMYPARKQFAEETVDDSDSDSVDSDANSATGLPQSESPYAPPDNTPATPSAVLMSMSFHAPSAASSLVKRQSPTNHGSPPRDSNYLALVSSSGGAPPPSGTTFKIFVLLLNPSLKIFELIQVVYNPATATVGDILDLVPQNATEPLLGRQKHIGLIRPGTHHASDDGMSEAGMGSAKITNLSVLASGIPGNEERVSANIQRGEILVAIPSGFGGRQIAAAAVPILRNKQVARLLGRADPLSPKNMEDDRRQRREQKNENGLRRSGSQRHQEEGRHERGEMGQAINDDTF